MFKKESIFWVVLPYTILIFLCVLAWLEQNINLTDYIGEDWGAVFYTLQDGVKTFGSAHLWLFYTSVALMACYLIYQLQKLPQGSKLIENSINEETFKSYESNDTFNVNHDLEFVADIIKRAMRAFGFHILEAQSGKEIYFWAEKHRLNRWGMYIIHLSLLVVLLGALIGNIFGFKKSVTLVAGAQQEFEYKSMSIKQDMFNINFYKDSNIPKVINSSVGLYQKEKLIINKEIRFNSPLEYNGLRIYQSQYDIVIRDAQVEIEIPQNYRQRKKTRLIRLHFGRVFPIERTRLSIRLDSFVPDYGQNENGFYSRSAEWNNPAILLSLFKKDELVGRDWLFSRMPDYQKNIFKTNVGYKLKLNEINPAYSSTYFINFDPGLKVVWVGFGLLLIGLVLQFYLVNRNVKILIRSRNKNTAVLIAGESVRDRLMFNEYFKKIVRELKKANK
ncbi:MAG: cytochrome c biogenesis protein ResB [bacterium]